eukprot:scaffold351_cov117-Isochrysis_galbana.AAC.7
MFLFALGVKPSVLFIVPKIFLRLGHWPRWTEDSTYFRQKRRPRCIMYPPDFSVPPPDPQTPDP